MNLEKILPKNGPSIDEVKKYIDKYLEEIIVIKCGGSVLLNENLFKQFIEDISVIYKLGLSVIVVHGGGKNIKKKLDELNIESKFIDGLRVTDEITIKVVEEALLELNSEIINNLKNLFQYLEEDKKIKVDYLEVRDDELLLTQKNKNARLFISFYIEDIRIIDNFKLY